MRYWSSYELEQSPGTTYDQFSIERAHRATTNEQLSSPMRRQFDTPVMLLEAPQAAGLEAIG